MMEMIKKISIIGIIILLSLSTFSFGTHSIKGDNIEGHWYGKEDEQYTKSYPTYGSLSGRITDVFNNPIRNVRVRVYFHDLYAEDYTDGFGQYYVAAIPICYCLKEVIVQKEGYEPISKMMTIKNTIKNFTLSPKNIIYVDDNGTSEYSTIQNAVDNATNQSTVYVYNGTYFENVRINKPILLQGESKYKTIIDGGGTCDVVYVGSDDVTISGFTISNSGELYDNAGIDLNSYNNTVIDNIIKNNENDGVNIVIHSGNIILKNTFSKNRDGIFLYQSTNNHVIDNVFISDGINLFGFFLDHYNSHRIENNTADGKLIRYYKNSRNVTIPKETAQVILVNCSHFIIQNLTISHVPIGVQLSYSSNNLIQNNNILSVQDGILLEESSNNLIKNNRIGNTHSHGIAFSKLSARNEINGNRITESHWNGISLFSISNNNTITKNNISNTKEKGLFLTSLCSENLIYKNNFINNSKNAIDLGTNMWDNGRIGNYWDDYKKEHQFAHKKLFRPWIWNKPYEIIGNQNYDYFPLSLPYSEDNIIFILSEFIQNIFN